MICIPTHKPFKLCLTTPFMYSIFPQMFSLQPDPTTLGGDPSKMWDQFVANMVPVITRVVRFCKRLPGKTM